MKTQNENYRQDQMVEELNQPEVITDPRMTAETDDLNNEEDSVGQADVDSLLAQIGPDGDEDDLDEDDDLDTDLGDDDDLDTDLGLEDDDDDLDTDDSDIIDNDLNTDDTDLGGDVDDDDDFDLNSDRGI